MKSIYYHSGTYSNNMNPDTCSAGEADSFVTELFFALMLGAYTILVWELGGGLLSALTGIISFLCMLRVIYLMTEWLKDSFGSNMGRDTGQGNSISTHAGQSALERDNKASGKKKKYTSRRFRMAGI